MEEGDEKTLLWRCEKLEQPERRIELRKGTKLRTSTKSSVEDNGKRSKVHKEVGWRQTKFRQRGPRA